jgi:uncharacterized membrane protein
MKCTVSGANWKTCPLFMHHLASVSEVDALHSRWEAIIPANLGRIRWNAEIVKDEYGTLIGWQSIAGSTIENAGRVEFRDVEEGTELRVTITYRPPAGDIGVALAKVINPGFPKNSRARYTPVQRIH